MDKLNKLLGHEVAAGMPSWGGRGILRQAGKLLDEYLASLDILSRRADLSDDAKAAVQKSLIATLTRKINDAVTITPAS